MALPDSFSRDAFEKEQEPTRLATELASVLSERLRAASDPAIEAEAILEDLKAIGHTLWSWDESGDFKIYGDDYMRPGPTRFMVTMRWSVESECDSEAPDRPFAEVEFGPWPGPT